MSPEDVRAARAALGMTQAELAEALGLAPASGRDTVRAWEGDQHDKRFRPISGPAALTLRFLLRELISPHPIPMADDLTVGKMIYMLTE